MTDEQILRRLTLLKTRNVLGLMTTPGYKGVVSRFGKENPYPREFRMIANEAARMCEDLANYYGRGVYKRVDQYVDVILLSRDVLHTVMFDFTNTGEATLDLYGEKRGDVELAYRYYKERRDIRKVAMTVISARGRSAETIKLPIGIFIESDYQL